MRLPYRLRTKDRLYREARSLDVVEDTSNR